MPRYLLKRERERLSWPEWETKHERWAKAFNREHKWRVDRLHDDSDLLQEAWLVFNYVYHAYPRILDPNHLFALFKRAMVNKMNDRACRVKRRRDSPEGPISCDIYEVLAGRMGEVTNGGYMAAVLNEAPEELKLVMAMIEKGKLDPQPRYSRELSERKNLSMRAREFLNARGVFTAFSQDPIREIRALFT